MAILADVPFDVGEIDDKLYTHAQIHDINISIVRQRITLVLGWGTIEDGNFIPGKHSVETFGLEGIDFAEIGLAPTLDGETVYDSVKRVAYSWIQSRYPRYSGSIT